MRFVVEKALSLAALTAWACSVDVDAFGAGKACSSDGRCSEGYHCSAERRCVASPANHDATAGHAGAAGTDSGHGGTVSGGTAGSHATVDGQGGANIDAASDVTFPDAGGPDGTITDARPAEDVTPPLDAGCASPTRYYRDADRDGFGRDDSTQWACTPPSGSWATSGNDCNDGDNRVFPRQPAFFGSGYAQASGDSFDYDCSGSEQPDPGQPGPAPDCANLSVVDCTGSGFESTNRSGPTADPICGSTRLVECVPTLVVCSARTSTTQPKRCH